MSIQSFKISGSAKTQYGSEGSSAYGRVLAKLRLDHISRTEFGGRQYASELQ